MMRGESGQLRVCLPKHHFEGTSLEVGNIVVRVVEHDAVNSNVLVRKCDQFSRAKGHVW